LIVGNALYLIKKIMKMKVKKVDIEITYSSNILPMFYYKDIFVFGILYPYDKIVIKSLPKRK